MSGERFNGRVGVIVEVAPGQFYQYVVKEAALRIEMDQGRGDRLPAAGTVMSGPVYVTMELSGRLVSRDEYDRPAWAAPAGELESGRAIEGAMTDG